MECVHKRGTVRYDTLSSVDLSRRSALEEDLTVTLPNFAFFKGRIVPYSEAKVGVLTHTFNYGTGVFGGAPGLLE